MHVKITIYEQSFKKILHLVQPQKKCVLLQQNIEYV